MQIDVTVKDILNMISANSTAHNAVQHVIDLDYDALNFALTQEHVEAIATELDHRWASAHKLISDTQPDVFGKTYTVDERIMRHNDDCTRLDYARRSIEKLSLICGLLTPRVWVDL